MSDHEETRNGAGHGGHLAVVAGDALSTETGPAPCAALGGAPAASVPA